MQATGKLPHLFRMHRKPSAGPSSSSPCKFCTCQENFAEKQPCSLAIPLPYHKFWILQSIHTGVRCFQGSYARHSRSALYHVQLFSCNSLYPVPPAMHSEDSFASISRQHFEKRVPKKYHLLVHQHRLDSEERQRSRSWLLCPHTRQGCDHVGTSLRLPPGVRNWATLLTHVLQPATSFIGHQMVLQPVLY